MEDNHARFPFATVRCGHFDQMSNAVDAIDLVTVAVSKLSPLLLVRLVTRVDWLLDHSGHLTTSSQTKGLAGPARGNSCFRGEVAKRIDGAAGGDSRISKALGWILRWVGCDELVGLNSPSCHWRDTALGSIFIPMSVHDSYSGREAPGGTVRVGDGPDGLMTYLIDLPPEALPSVCKRDLERAWYAAREAALAARQGAVRGFRFNHPDGSHTDLALADRDARCWVGAVDRTVGIAHARGLSLCLRLLALIDLLAHAPWARSLFHLASDGAEFHPALLRAAATQPLTSDARFDEAGFRMRLSRFVTGLQIEAPQAAQRLSGAH
jgi:hypothetical protein